MRRQYLVSLLIVGASLFLLGCFPGGVAAQDGNPASLDDVAALFKRPSVPVRLYGLDEPDSLAVCEKGRFAAANIEAASLPFRFLWAFGDGTTASSLHARHRFTVPGTYPVTFSISNSYSEATDTLFVTVVAPVEDEPTAHHAAGRDGMVRLAEVDMNQLGHHLRRPSARTPHALPLVTVPVTIRREEQAMANVKPLSDRVVVRPKPAEEKTQSGLFIPDTAKEKPQQGTVVSVGPGRVEDGTRIEMTVKEGDTILYGKYAGTELTLNGEEVLIIRENDILGVVQE